MIRLFVGLGNPGPDYEATRHNAGFWWIDALARELKVQLQPERGYWGLAAGGVFIVLSFFIKGWSNGANDASGHAAEASAD